MWDLDFVRRMLQISEKNLHIIELDTLVFFSVIRLNFLVHSYKVLIRLNETQGSSVSFYFKRFHGMIILLVVIAPLSYFRAIKITLN